METISRLIIIVFFITNCSTLQNVTQVCAQMRKSLFEISDQIKSMAPSTRSDLALFSLRGFNYQILQSLKFNNPQKEKQIKSLVKETINLRKSYESFMKLSDEALKESLKADKQKEIDLSNRISDKTMTMNRLSMSTLVVKKKLAKMTQHLSFSDPEILNKIHLVKDLELLVLQLNSESKVSKMNLAILDKISLNKLADDETIQTLITRYKAIAKDVFLGKEYLDSRAVMVKYVQITNSKDVDNAFKLFGARMDALEESASNLGFELHGLLVDKIADLRQDINSNKGYLQYKSLMKKAKNNTKQMARLRIGIEKLDSQYTSSLSSLYIGVWKRWRVTPQNLLDLETISESISKSRSIISKKYNAKLFKDKKANSLLKNIYTVTVRKHNDLSLTDAEYVTRRNILRKIFKNEGKLDQILGEVFSNLQSTNNKDSNTFDCFSSSELSLYFYYMSVTQIIFSKEKFMMSFLSSFQETKAVQVTKQIFIDIRQGGFIDFKMIPLYSKSFALNGYQLAATNFSLLMSHEISQIFKGYTHINKKQGYWGVYHSIMKFMGFNRESVVASIKGFGGKKLLSKLAVGLLAIVGVISSTGIGVMLLTAIVVELLYRIVKGFYKWVQPYGDRANDIKTDFVLMISDVYQSIVDDHLDSFDYQTILKELNYKEYKQHFQRIRGGKKKGDDRTGYYKSLFESFQRLTEYDYKTNSLSVMKYI